MSVHQRMIEVAVVSEKLRKELRGRYRCLQEAFYMGSPYSLSYRWYRFCEAFSLLGDDN